MGYRVAPIGLEKLSRIVAGRVARKAKGFLIKFFDFFFQKFYSHWKRLPQNKRAIL
jgi:hypothetical protein